MTIRLIQIGNSKGIRISNALIKQYELSEEVELSLERDGIKIAQKRNTLRDGWSKDAEKVAKLTQEDKEWLEAPLTSDEDWTW